MREWVGCRTHGWLVILGQPHLEVVSQIRAGRAIHRPSCLVQDIISLDNHLLSFNDHTRVRILQGGRKSTRSCSWACLQFDNWA